MTSSIGSNSSNSSGVTVPVNPNVPVGSPLATMPFTPTLQQTTNSANTVTNTAPSPMALFSQVNSGQNNTGGDAEDESESGATAGSANSTTTAALSNEAALEEVAELLPPPKPLNNLQTEGVITNTFVDGFEDEQAAQSNSLAVSGGAQFDEDEADTTILGDLFKVF